jgi:hypothetical protein
LNVEEVKTESAAETLMRAIARAEEKQCDEVMVIMSNEEGYWFVMKADMTLSAANLSLDYIKHWLLFDRRGENS